MKSFNESAQLKIVRLIVNEQFEGAKKDILRQLCLYLGFFFFPFLYQAFSSEDLPSRIGLWICFAAESRLLVIECLQCRGRGVEYFKDLQNWLELAGIVLFFFYFAWKQPDQNRSFKD